MSKKWMLDLALTAVLLLLMGYSLIGEALHEWLGVAMLALLVLHHLWNRGWYRGLGKGRRSAYRVAQTVLTGLLLVSCLGTLLSGLCLSRYVLDGIPLRGGEDLARSMHLPCAFWSLLLMGLHLGLHWGAVMGLGRRLTGRRPSSRVRATLLRCLAAAVAGYGLWAFFRRGLPDVLLLRTHFLFFPPDLTAARFLADCGAMLGLFVSLGYYGGRGLRRCSAGKETLL